MHVPVGLRLGWHRSRALIVLSWAALALAAVLRRVGVFPVVVLFDLSASLLLAW